MWKHSLALAVTAVVAALYACAASAQVADAARGLQVFASCAPCHSLSPGDALDGPSLAGLWMRRAGSAPEFRGYSQGMLRSPVVWDASTLDRYLLDPQAIFPGSRSHAAVAAPQDRADLIAFLQRVAVAPAAQPDVEGETVEGVGMVVAAGAGNITIKHGAIPGFMAAMTMTYAAEGVEELGALAPGDRIGFTVDRATMNILGVKRLP